MYAQSNQFMHFLKKFYLGEKLTLPKFKRQRIRIDSVTALQKSAKNKKVCKSVQKVCKKCSDQFATKVHKYSLQKSGPDSKIIGKSDQWLLRYCLTYLDVISRTLERCNALKYDALALIFGNRPFLT